MNTMDLGIIGFVAVGFLYGYHKGFFKTIFGLVGYLISMIISLIYYKQIGEFLNATFNLNDKLFPFVKGVVKLPAELQSIPLNGESISQINSVLNGLSLSPIYKKAITNYLGQMAVSSNNPNIHTLGDGIVYLLTTILINGLTIVLICMVVERIFALLGNILNKRKSIGIAAKVDKLIGGSIGGSLNVIMVMAMLVVMTPVLTFSASNPNSPMANIAGLVSNSLVAQTLMGLVQGIGFKL